MASTYPSFFTAENSPYSSFFTAGLTFTTDESLLATRRGSLPTDSLSSTRSPDRSSDNHFALHTKSFLSLDLAESQSSRTASLKAMSNSSVDPLTRFSRASRDSLRSGPSPKPAPSALLPQLPLSNKERRSALPPLSLSQLPSSPPLSSQNFLERRPTTRSTTTVSTSHRRTKRTHALARLEGRSNSMLFAVPSAENFMSLSDDEDEVDDAYDADSAEELLPQFASSIGSSFAFGAANTDSVIIPVSSRPGNKRRSSLVSNWFPLSSFMDLKDQEDNSWAWRSFMQISVT
ncbi:hypothetical protein C8J56DRAFT_928373 [Mycena floridula]|nr:hypothetical protein C8J56DRAFT_928373 [Mycena floridula]